MADSNHKPRFDVADHFVVDRKQKKHAPFSEPAGARVVADALNAGSMTREMFAWVDGLPEHGKATKAADET